MTRPPYKPPPEPFPLADDDPRRASNFERRDRRVEMPPQWGVVLQRRVAQLEQAETDYREDTRAVAQWMKAIHGHVEHNSKKLEGLGMTVAAQADQLQAYRAEVKTRAQYKDLLLKVWRNAPAVLGFIALLKPELRHYIELLLKLIAGV